MHYTNYLKMLCLYLNTLTIGRNIYVSILNEKAFQKAFQHSLTIISQKVKTEQL